MKYEKEERLDAAIGFLQEYDCYAPYIENLSIVLDCLKELRGV